MFSKPAVNRAALALAFSAIVWASFAMVSHGATSPTATETPSASVKKNDTANVNCKRAVRTLSSSGIVKVRCIETLCTPSGTCKAGEYQNQDGKWVSIENESALPSSVTDYAKLQKSLDETYGRIDSLNKEQTGLSPVGDVFPPEKQEELATLERRAQDQEAVLNKIVEAGRSDTGSDLAEAASGRLSPEQLSERVAVLAREKTALDPKIQDIEGQSFTAPESDKSGDSLGATDTFSDPARDAKRAKVVEAIGEVLPGATITRDGSVIKARDAFGQTTHAFDADSGRIFLSKTGKDFPTLYNANGEAAVTSKDSESWTKSLPALDTPEKFSAFEGLYFDKGSVPDRYTPINLSGLPTYDEDGNETGKSPDERLVGAIQGKQEQVVSRDAYDAVRAQGDVANGTDRLIERVRVATEGKVQFDSPSSFAKEEGINDRHTPTDLLSPLSSEKRAQVLAAIEREVEKYPQSYWENAKPLMIYTYGGQLDQVGGGYASKDRIWINGRADQDFIPRAFQHELAHYNDTRTFVSNEQFATKVYGDSYGKAYGGASGAEAIARGKFDWGAPEGFARTYGYEGGISEDKATIVETMFMNYPYVEEVAKTDTVFAQKVQIIKDGFYQTTGGAMNDAYWQNLKPIDPSYRVARKPFIVTWIQNMFK